MSILEPYVGNSTGIPLVPSKPYFPKFPHLGSCAWSMNQKVHIFGMIMNWFQVVPKAFMAWLWLPLVLDRMSWRRKEIQLAETSQLFVMSPQLYVTWEMMKFSLARKGLTPARHVSPFWFWLDKLELMVMGSNYQVKLKFDWTAHVSFSCWDLYMGWTGSAGLCNWASLGLVIPTKMNSFAIGNIYGLL